MTAYERLTGLCEGHQDGEGVVFKCDTHCDYCDEHHRGGCQECNEMTDFMFLLKRLDELVCSTIGHQFKNHAMEGRNYYGLGTIWCKRCGKSPQVVHHEYMRSLMVKNGAVNIS